LGEQLYCSTAVLPKIPHSNCSKRVPNRPLRPRRSRFGTLLELLQCGIFGRTAVYVVVITRLAIGKEAMLAQSDAFLLRSLTGEQEHEWFCASTQPRGSASGQAQHPSKEDWDGKSKSARSTQERRPRTRLDGGGWAWMGMDGLRREPSRRQHRCPVSRPAWH